MTFDSDHVEDFSHDGETLTVRFNNGKTKATYRIQNVSPEVYTGMVATRSKGSYYHRFIRNYPKRYQPELIHREVIGEGAD